MWTKSKLKALYYVSLLGKVWVDRLSTRSPKRADWNMCFVNLLYSSFLCLPWFMLFFMLTFFFIVSYSAYFLILNGLLIYAVCFTCFLILPVFLSLLLCLFAHFHSCSLVTSCFCLFVHWLSCFLLLSSLFFVTVRLLSCSTLCHHYNYFSFICFYFSLPVFLSPRWIPFLLFVAFSRLSLPSYLLALFFFFLSHFLVIFVPFSFISYFSFF